MLTRKQKELLVFIHQRLGEGGVSPSFDEMRDALGLKSKSGIHRLITGLEERGVIRRLPHRARALEIIRLPDGFAADGGSRATVQTTTPASHQSSSVPLPRGSSDWPAFAPGAASSATPSPETAFGKHKLPTAIGQARPTLGGSPRTIPSPPMPSSVEIVSLPIYGRIAAGTPIEALRDLSSYAEVPGTLIGSGDHYALQVEGDSMVDAGILDGDLAVIRRQATAENGNVVVALIDGLEATLKRFRRRSGAIALEAANPAYETRLLPPDRIEIQGQLVAIIRRYE